MKKIVLLFATLLLSATSMAQVVITEPVLSEPQSAEAQPAAPRLTIKERLARPAQVDSLTVVNETVVVQENGDAAAIVSGNLNQEPKAIGGYRIVIFMNNSQSARRDAVAAQESFSQLFPEEQSYLSYENPYFKVTVGNCTSQDEAIILLGRLRGTFPKAFIVRENIAIGEFAR
ncbi:MAG: hypothetical protein E7147_04630 [Rikenellaceae bacterium]|nr:hypothetical protein [Rikenellaceae bacterium]